MRKMLFVTMVIIVALATAPAFATVIFSEDFDNGINASVWTQVSTSAPFVFDSARDCENSPASGSAHSTTTNSRMWANMATQTSEYFWFEYSFYDGGVIKQWAEIRGTSDGTYGGSLVQLFAVGKYNNAGGLGGEAYDGTKYQGRIVFGSNTGWFNLNAAGAPSRSIGWHTFAIERLTDGSTINFYVDGILSKTVTGASYCDMGVVVLGGYSGTTAGDSWFDGVSVTVPEPGSMLALGTGLVGLLGFIRRKRA